MNPVWIVDDDSSIRWVLEKALSKKKVACEIFSNPFQVIDALEKEIPRVLISDIRMPGKSGLVLLDQVKSKYPELPVIIMTAFSDLDNAVSAFQGGAYEYLPKPFDISSAVELISRVLNESYSNENADNHVMNGIDDLLGSAPKMQELFRAIGKLSQSSTSVLVTGETGTGKELIAKALHKHSPRSLKPFIAINMAAIPKDLLESELFGHERGAFTGAQNLRKGRFEQANSGTLFLDEIGDMPFELQTRLLRVLSDGRFFRVGGVTPIEVNVRIIAATHQDLDDRVKKGLFREDLYHRINIIRLKVPPLRERVEDISLLADHFLEKSSISLSVEKKILSSSAKKEMEKYKFSGNVRQLENFCHWLTVMAPSNVIKISDLPIEFKEDDVNHINENDFTSIDSSKSLQVSTSDQLKSDKNLKKWRDLLKNEIDNSLIQLKEKPDEATYQYWINEIDKIIFTAVLEFTKGRRVDASQILEIGRNTVTKKIKSLNLPF